MNKRQRQAAAKRELKRIKGLDLMTYWSIHGLENIDMRPAARTSETICAEDIDEAPRVGSEMCRQMADGIMRTYVRTALNQYIAKLQDVAKTGEYDLHDGG